MSKWTSTLISYKPYLERGNNTNTSGAKRGKGAARNPSSFPPPNQFLVPNTHHFGIPGFSL